MKRLPGVLAGPARYQAPLPPWNGETFHLLCPGALSAPVPVPFASDGAGRVSSIDDLGYGFRRVAPLKRGNDYKAIESAN